MRRARAQRIAGLARERLGADGVNLLQLLRAPRRGRRVFHFHIHVIPRYAGDPLRLPWMPAPGDPAEIAAAAAALGRELTARRGAASFRPDCAPTRGGWC